MSWYSDAEIGDTVVVSTRARYARNVEDYPFDVSDSSVMSNELTERVCNAMPIKCSVIKMADISSIDSQALLEQHMISPDFMKQKNGVLLFNEEKGIYLMTPEEDHLRLQVIAKGYCPESVLRSADEILGNLSDKLKFSFDVRLGFLTRCPTNLGHGLRLSVMLFLPALTANGEISRLGESLSALGFNLRGMYGEGSRAIGCLYQVSNRSSLGATKKEILDAFISVVDKIRNEEEKARMRIDMADCADCAGRAYGILKYAGKLTYDEFLCHYASLRLGYSLSLDLPADCNVSLLDSLVMELAPAMITKKYNCKNSTHRDVSRAKEIKIKLKGDL